MHAGEVVLSNRITSFSKPQGLRKILGKGSKRSEEKNRSQQEFRSHVTALFGNFPEFNKGTPLGRYSSAKKKGYWHDQFTLQYWFCSPLKRLFFS